MLNGVVGNAITNGSIHNNNLGGMVGNAGANNNNGGGNNHTAMNNGRNIRNGGHVLGGSGGLTGVGGGGGLPSMHNMGGVPPMGMVSSYKNNNGINNNYRYNGRSTTGTGIIPKKGNKIKQKKPSTSVFFVALSTYNPNDYLCLYLS